MNWKYFLKVICVFLLVAMAVNVTVKQQPRIQRLNGFLALLGSGRPVFVRTITYPSVLSELHTLEIQIALLWILVVFASIVILFVGRTTKGEKAVAVHKSKRPPLFFYCLKLLSVKVKKRN